MKKHISILPLLLCFFITLSAYTQDPNLKHTYKWYFGYGAGLDFSSGEPVPLTDGQTFYMEGSFVVNDDEGDLLFYGQPDTIWNKNHEIMLNSIGYGNPNPVTQIHCIKQPGVNSLYYLFHTRTDTPWKISYSIIDLNGDSGLGELVSTQDLLFNTVDGIGAVQHCNGTDVWISGKEIGSKDIQSWLLTENGLETTPIISSNVVQIPYTENASVNIIFSPDNSKAAVTYLNGTNSSTWGSSDVELYEFDNCTGTFPNAIQINAHCPYGVCFSPDNTKLYVGSTVDCILGNSEEGRLVQYNLSNFNQSDIVASETVLRSGVEYAANDMRIGPDGKIYVCDWDTLKQDTWNFSLFFLGIIENPNEAGIACNYLEDELDLGGYFLPNGLCLQCHIGGLPEFLPHYYNQLSTQENQKIEMTIYPNPTHNFVSITSESQEAIIELYTLDGKLLNARSFSFSTDLTLEKYASGIYIIQLKNKEQQFLLTHKIVKL